jgi:hypothetical protein
MIGYKGPYCTGHNYNKFVTSHRLFVLLKVHLSHHDRGAFVMGRRSVTQGSKSVAEQRKNAKNFE